MSAHPPATPSTSMPSIITAIEADRIWIGGQAAHHSEHAHYVRADIADALLEALEVLVAELESTLPPGLYPEGSWLDILPHLDDPVADARAAIAKAKGDPA